MVQNNQQPIVPALDDRVLEDVIVRGDIAKLQPRERLLYYKAECAAYGLDWRKRPFEYVEIDGRLVLYAGKRTADQLAHVHRLSQEILDERMLDGGIYLVRVRVTSPDGRSTVRTGAVALENLRGLQRANAILRCETKAFRRAVLAHCGLGVLDETEIDDIPDARRITITEAHGEDLPEERTSDEWIEAIARATTIRELSMIGNDVVRRYRDPNHPVRRALKDRIDLLKKNIELTDELDDSDVQKGA